MRTAICVLALVACTWAMPSDLLQVDWSKVKPMDVFMDPLPHVKPDIGERIVGGFEAARHSIPYQAALLIDGESFCGGALITPRWVLSAAHCTRGASYVIVTMGAHDIHENEPNTLITTSRNITNHPRFNSTSLSNDISLIRLPYDLLLSPSIQLINLAPPNSGTFSGSTALVSGWGTTSDTSTTIAEILHAVNVSIITNAVCQSNYGSIIHSTNICTSGSGRVGACNGDAGGPLVVGDILVGIVSFSSSRGCQTSLPTVYTRVSSQRTWINSVTGI